MAAVILAATAAVFLVHHVGAQAPDLECTQLSDAPNDGAPLAIGLKPHIVAAQVEAACRSALKADPVNPRFMFLLGRALALGNKHLEAMKYYLEAADRAHPGAMNDLGGV